MKKVIYLEKYGCSHDSYYECFALHIKKSDFAGCPSKCLPESMKSLGRINLTYIPTCNSENETACSWNHIYSDIFQNQLDDSCPKPCEILEYTGKIDYIESKSVSETANDTLKLYLRFSRPFSMTVNEEYIIYDLIGVIGSAGGTLGMFIGFTFYDLIVRFTSFCEKIVN